MGNLISQNALHAESPKQLFITIFIPVLEHAHSQTFNVFVLFFPFVYSPFYSYMAKLIFYIHGQTDFLQFSVNEVASMAAMLVRKLCFFGGFKKKNPWLKNPCLCYIISFTFLAYTCIIYILLIYIRILAFFRRGRSVRLIRLEKRSLSVGKNFGLAKTLVTCVCLCVSGCVPQPPACPGDNSWPL